MSHKEKHSESNSAKQFIFTKGVKPGEQAHWAGSSLSFYANTPLVGAGPHNPI